MTAAAAGGAGRGEAAVTADVRLPALERGRPAQRAQDVVRGVFGDLHHERHSLVEIPEHAADDVLRSLRGATTLKGRKANIRRDRGFAPSGAPRRGGRQD